jgi:hypothetical protein
MTKEDYQWLCEAHPELKLPGLRVVNLPASAVASKPIIFCAHLILTFEGRMHLINLKQWSVEELHGLRSSVILGGQIQKGSFLFQSESADYEPDFQGSYIERGRTNNGRGEFTLHPQEFQQPELFQ